ncbi:pilus assembly protein PilY [Spongiibacter sp. KMU-158]|uniref:Pilus assembly protein PilY n=2 Tax=Spongiibacter pelagi TaxID=2760804 RepID=A0A927C243_9GAMM|nr:pilus assembly protein PilY [Spongiibacter pelagi]
MYSTSGNILRVDNRGIDKDDKYCRAKFTVTGQKVGCDGATGDDSIAQKPLFLTQSAAPNVMYILDDSGSMHFELMPDDIIIDSARYVFPRADGVYGSGDYDNRVPTVDAGSAFNARSRSPQVNSLYYNPGITYDPWIKWDGTSYPAAVPTCAWHNPERTNSNSATYCRNLTTNNSNYNDVSWRSCTSSSSCSSTTNNKTFWPATYYWMKDTSASSWSSSNFDKVEIRSGTTYSGHGREGRDDCTTNDDGTCTYTEEMQNFANWYTYYRSRILTARAGSGFAFAGQSADIRVGFASINQGESTVDGVKTNVIVNGVRDFAGDDRKSFYSSLYTRSIPSAGTPLRRALDAAGTYFMRKDSKGPWSDSPGESSNEDQLICRRNYSILMTDGYWSGSAVSGSAGDNNDGTGGPTWTNPFGKSYTYKAISPFTDNREDTLADVAMYYWKNDLRTDMSNEVFENKSNPAFWQHMTTYGVGFGVTGTVDPKSAFAAITTGDSITWPDPGSAEKHKIDDLLHAGVNSRGGFFSAANPDQFANELATFLENIANESKSSASSIAANSTRLDSGTLIYQASFNSLEWTGRIVAYTLQDNGQLDQVYWDTDKNGIPAHGSRKIIATAGDVGGIVTSATDFTTSSWASFTADQKAFLQNSGSETDGKNLLNWLRGDKTNEGSDYRPRTGLLGDIVNSDPFFTGNSENFGFGFLGGSEGTSYATFLSSKSSRTPMIYVGANDGMLHGFDAQTGIEKMAFIPTAVFENLPDLADVDYTHRYFVDSSPRVLDAYLGGTWKSVLVSGTGAGGRAVFALDVTSPSTFSKNNFMWEFSTADDAADKLGVAMSEPSIARLKASDKWVAIFGNGYDSGDNVKLFIVDLATGSLLKAIDTGVSGTNNGLGTAVPVDVDGDKVTDYVYAGDLTGNLWKFDLTGAAIDDWSVAYSASGSPAPLFKAVDDDGDPQPITARPTVGRHPGGGYMVYVGTGRYFMESDSHTEVDPQVQSFYGIRDNGAIVARGDLLEQEIQYEGFGTLSNGSTTAAPIRIVSDNSPDSAPTYGWYLNLIYNTAEGERSVSRPILRNGRIIFSTIIPSESLCGYGGRSWLMELDAVNGGRIDEPVLDINNDGKIDELDKVLIDGKYYPVSGLGFEEMIKTPGIIGAGDLEYKFTSGSSGSIGVITESGDGAENLGRQSWRHLQ